ncbi:DUF5590 domain-containing protein [Peribacillus frigoritolerans]|nr:DUF5590 domain-containing protein [Peribacillus frigoritolerans]
MDLSAGHILKRCSLKKEAGNEAFKKAKEEGGLVTMEEFYLYNGQDSYSVIIGEGEKGTKKIVWLPEDKKKEIVVENYKDGKSKKRDHEHCQRKA